MVRVGLTGGIGSGKSTVSALLASHGAVVIDADLLAREVVAAGTPGLGEIVEEFGSGLLTPGGELDRSAMGERVFADAAARGRLERIIHPRVRERAAAIEAVAPPDAVVVHDIPLLVETGQAGQFDAVIVVDVPPDVQRDRLTTLRSMSAAEADSRIRAQATREERLSAADHVIVNDGTLDDLADRVSAVWRAITTG